MKISAITCAVLGCAFVVVGAPHVWEALRAQHFGPALPYHTSNIYFSGLLHIPNGSERLQYAFSALPPDRPVAVVLRDDDEESTFVGYLVSYFGWPREVRFLPLKPENAAGQLQSLDRAPLGAIFFHGIDPPVTMQPVIRIGSGLVMIPTATTPEAVAP